MNKNFKKVNTERLKNRRYEASVDWIFIFQRHDLKLPEITLIIKVNKQIIKLYGNRGKLRQK